MLLLFILTQRVHSVYMRVKKSKALIIYRMHAFSIFANKYLSIVEKSYETMFGALVSLLAVLTRTREFSCI